MTSESTGGSSRSADLAERITAYRAATEQFLTVASALSEADLDRQPTRA